MAQCVDAWLVYGKKLHVHASLIEADAAKESVIKAAPPLIPALKQTYRRKNRGQATNLDRSELQR